MFTEDKMNTKSFLNSLIELKIFFNADITKRKISLSLNRLKSEVSQRLSVFESDCGPNTTADIDTLAQLLDVFYQQLNFKGVDVKHSQFSDYLDIDYVLKNKKGHDFILSALFSTVAKEQGICASPVFFLGQVLIRIDLADEDPIFLDAQSGDELTYREIELMARAYEHIETIDENILEPQETSFLVMVYLGLLKTSYVFEKKLDLALKASNLMIALKADDPYLRRDRGMILAGLGCPQAAVKEFNFFIEKCPNDAMTEITKAQISAILPEPLPIH